MIGISKSDYAEMLQLLYKSYIFTKNTPGVLVTIVALLRLLPNHQNSLKQDSFSVMIRGIVFFTFPLSSPSIDQSLCDLDALEFITNTDLDFTTTNVIEIAAQLVSWLGNAVSKLFSMPVSQMFILFYIDVISGP
jgi:hypothetical protein